MRSEPLIDDFLEDWLLFQNIIARNYMNHREVITVLRRWVTKRNQPSMRILDLGCGDSYVARRVFKGLDDVQYYGIDQSSQALDVARNNFTGYKWNIELPHGDFTKLIRQLHGPFDLVIAGYVFHSLNEEDKATALDNIRLILRPGGTLIIYDFLPKKGERIDSYKARTVAHAEASWPYLEPSQLASYREHIETRSFPIEQSSWTEYTYASGLGQGKKIYRDDAELFGMLKFSH